MLSIFKKKSDLQYSFPEIPENNTFAVGDIHGCLEELKQLLDSLPLNRESVIIFLGDYIDRGSDSKGVVSFLLEFRKKHTCIFLMGNHEQLLLDFLDFRRFEPWLRNGGKQTIDSYTVNGEQMDIPGDHLQFFRSCEYFLETENFLFVHGGIPADQSIKNALKNSKVKLIWERDHIKATKYKWEKTIVCGHTPQKEAVLKEKLIAIDTGCVYGKGSGYGYLTAIQIPSRKLFQIESLNHATGIADTDDF